MERHLTPTADKRTSLKRRAVLVGLLVTVLWALEIVDQWVLDKSLDSYGIKPRSWTGLWGILWAPFLHGGFGHLLTNTVPFFILGCFVILGGIGLFFEVTLVVTVLGGLGTWLIGASNSVHLGASGLIFGYFGFLLLRGYVERSLSAIAVAVVVGALYGGLLWGILPTRPGVSWEGHLCGFLGGAVFAWLSGRYGDQPEQNVDGPI